MSPHSCRTASALAGPGFTTTTRKMAAALSGVTTACGSASAVPAA